MVHSSGARGVTVREPRREALEEFVCLSSGLLPVCFECLERLEEDGGGGVEVVELSWLEGDDLVKMESVR